MHIAVIYPSRMIFLKDILSTITVSMKKVKEVPERNSNSFWVTVAKYELRKKCEPNTKCTLRPIPAIIHNLKKKTGYLTPSLTLLKSFPCQSALFWFYLDQTSANSHHPCNFITSAKHRKAQKLIYMSLMKSRWRLYDIFNINNTSSRIGWFWCLGFFSFLFW